MHTLRIVFSNPRGESRDLQGVRKIALDRGTLHFQDGTEVIASYDEKERRWRTKDGLFARIDIRANIDLRFLTGEDEGRVFGPYHHGEILNLILYCDRHVFAVYDAD